MSKKLLAWHKTLGRLPKSGTLGRGGTLVTADLSFFSRKRRFGLVRTIALIRTASVTQYSQQSRPRHSVIAASGNAGCLMRDFSIFHFLRRIRSFGAAVPPNRSFEEVSLWISAKKTAKRTSLNLLVQWPHVVRFPPRRRYISRVLLFQTRQIIFCQLK